MAATSAIVTSDPLVAAAALAHDHLAVLPTETVYGLGARADHQAAIAQVYAAKQRPADHPLIVHVASAQAAWQWAVDVPAYAMRLAQQVWPGPMTLVLTRSARASDAITGGQGSVAIRVPAHPMFLAVLAALARACGDPAIGIAAPSANRFGRVSPTTIAHVIDELGAVLTEHDVILDGGACSVGLESTIIDATGSAPRILRPGALTAAQIAEITGLEGIDGSTGSDPAPAPAPAVVEAAVRAPGMLAAHYAPSARVHLVAELGELAAPGELSDATAPPIGLIALASVATPPGWVRLIEPVDIPAFAQSLYAALRSADALGLAHVVAVLPAPGGLGDAIRDRLTRAAHR